MKRRTLLVLFTGVALAAHPCLVLAKNGDGPGGNDSGGKDNGNGNGNGNGDGDGDGNGNGNGNGNDDGGNDNDDGGNDDSGNDVDNRDDSSGRSKKRDDLGWSQEKVLKERQLGRVISLTSALRIVSKAIHGRVIDIDLMVQRGKPQYRVKVRRTDGIIRTVRLDARSGKVIGFLDF